MTLPDLSVSVPNHRPTGDATTPAPQSTVPAGTFCPPTTIPSESTLVTRALVKTSTPKLSKCRCALRERPRDMWAESELFGDLYAESHVPKPCATFRRACWPSRRRPSRRPRVQMLGGDEFPQSGPLPALGVWTPLLQPARTQAGFYFESRRHHRVIRGPVRTDAIRHAQNSCTGCQSPE